MHELSAIDVDSFSEFDMSSLMRQHSLKLLCITD